MNNTPVLAFVWADSDETQSAELEAFMQSTRRRSRRRPRIGAFVASRPRPPGHAQRPAGHA